MRFAIATTNRYLGVFETFVQAGWQPLKLFTCPVTHEQNNQNAVIAFAERHQADIQLSRIMPHDLNTLRERGCEILIVASYEWKIPDWNPHLKYAINFHSSPLPEGRGAYPVVRAILEGREQWAITCHKLTSEFDRGDILAAENIPLGPDECHERLDLKIQMAARKLAAKVAGQCAELWDHAKPQAEGSYWPKHKIEERLIDFQKPVETVLRHIRAFGATESIAIINNTALTVKRAVGWVEPHNHKPGNVVHVFNRSIVMAVSDGYVGLIESDLAPIHMVAELQAKTPVQTTIVQTTLINKTGTDSR